MMSINRKVFTFITVIDIDEAYIDQQNMNAVKQENSNIALQVNAKNHKTITDTEHR